MGKRNQTGTMIFSFAVLAVAAGFVLYGSSTQSSHGIAQYPLTAQFISANGLARGGDVSLGGVPVGRVTDVHLDPKSAMAVVHFTVDDSLHFPVDSTLTIGSASMSGAGTLMIEPGKSTHLTKAGDVLTSTREPVSLEQQVSNYIFGNGGLPSE